MSFLYCISSFKGTSCFIGLSAFTSVDLIFHRFLELNLTLPEKKKIFVVNFPFLIDSLKPYTTPITTKKSAKHEDSFLPMLQYSLSQQQQSIKSMVAKIFIG